MKSIIIYHKLGQPVDSPDWNLLDRCGNLWNIFLFGIQL